MSETPRGGGAPVNLTGGLPETVLPAADPAAVAALASAMAAPEAEQREAVAAVVGRYPAFLEAWAALGRLARDPVEAYACCRVAYHRGLDALRAAGWRGSGVVRWSRETNRGFLDGLRGLSEAAAALGEDSEATRCRQFLAQLDPSQSRGSN